MYGKYDSRTKDKQMITDDNLIEISRGVDEYMSTLMKNYEISPLSLTAVFLARSMVLSNETGCTEDFIKMMVGIVNDPPTKPNVKVH